MNGLNSSIIPQTKQTIEALWRLEKIILDTLDFNDVVQKIVDSVLTELDYLKLGYRIVVLALVDHKTQELHRISISKTEEAKTALEITPVPFEEIDIPLTATNNLCTRAVLENRPFATHDWQEILVPPYSSGDEARKVQQVVGIKTSMVYPVSYRGQANGIMIFSMVKDVSEVSEDEKDLIRTFTDIVGLAVQNSRLYSELEDTSEKLKNANDQLKELDKLKDEFVSVASHELRTPMTSIKSYLWMALDGRGGVITEKQKYYLDRAYDSTDRLIKLVNDMLNVSRIESGRINIQAQSTDMAKLIDEVVAEIKPRVDELGLTLIHEPSEKLPEVLADPDKIKEVVINLIGNSLKFTPPGGTIRLWSEKKGEMVVTSVADTGRGIEKSDQERLFQKFGLIGSSYITNKASTQGTGLGLYISRSIIELLKGEIWVESDGEGKGATFHFSLRVFNQTDYDGWQRSQDGKAPIGLIHTEI